MPSRSTRVYASSSRNSFYPANRYYQGSFKFSRHFYERPADMNSEEEKCAITIDVSPKVQYWVRNVERSEYSYWMPTPSDRFFPDFVARLTDGRWLVVEYKGEHLVPPTTQGRRTGLASYGKRRAAAPAFFAW